MLYWCEVIPGKDHQLYTKYFNSLMREGFLQYLDPLNTTASIIAVIQPSFTVVEYLSIAASVITDRK
jgi:hypothetical protein